jgi:CrcB protein
MSLVWYVAAGSAVGGAARHLVGSFVQSRAGTAVPLGTLLVNVTGAFILGFVLRYPLESQSISPEVRALVAIGFCGGYTTFSAFSYETLGLIQRGDYRRAIFYAVLSVLLSLLGVVLGAMAGRALIGVRG